MARFCGNKDSTKIIDAAQYWRDGCLLGNKSIFGGSNIWTLENAGQLETFFVNNLDYGEGNFNEKLKQQLEPASDSEQHLLF